jgi:hypothetical protein
MAQDGAVLRGAAGNHALVCVVLANEIRRACARLGQLLAGPANGWTRRALLAGGGALVFGEDGQRCRLREWIEPRHFDLGAMTCKPCDGVAGEPLRVGSFA